MVNEFLNLFYVMIFVKRRSDIYKYYILYTIHIYTCKWTNLVCNNYKSIYFVGLIIFFCVEK